MGAGPVAESSEEDFSQLIGKEWLSTFSVDLKMKPSIVFKDEAAEEGEEL